MQTRGEVLMRAPELLSGSSALHAAGLRSHGRSLNIGYTQRSPLDRYCLCFGEGITENSESTGKKQYQIQNGPCSYTFLLPEPQNCGGPSSSYNQVQRDDMVDYDSSVQRLEQLENIMENNTQWLQKLENYIQDNLKQDMAQLQHDAVQNHTVTMIRIGTSLLSQTAEQTRKITTVEAQVINQTTRLERQLLENSISTSKLEKEIQQQINDIGKLREKNSFLEKRVEEMEGMRNTEQDNLKEEKEQLKKLVEKQTSIIKEMEQQLLRASSDNSAMKQQQQELTNTVNNLIHTISPGGSSAMMQDNPDQYHDCAAVFKSGNKESGVYTLIIPDTKQQFKAYCDMETDGGGWTVVQKRFNGLVDFHQTWKNYSAGFGDVSGEYWLGNQFISKLTQAKQHVLRIDLMDWEGNTAFSKYQQFSLDAEKQNYRIQISGYSGTAGRTSSMGQPGSDFSTKDVDNDKCVCKCSQMLSGGWWFDACGPSNLNGVYYQQGQNTNRFNGIKWYYWKGSAYSLKATTMMIRQADF
ncbi:Angiopoietin-2 [Triplophysa tibetana]|uniref:Angiopoietin-2 n=1 Tax=Triplophysa tibetana TaxID=1572043 RepID=A0A5A9P6P7_9TELE|nr:Angiopoietin-2 [Triplophysa tibetana]